MTDNEAKGRFTDTGFVAGATPETPPAKATQPSGTLPLLGGHAGSNSAAKWWTARSGELVEELREADFADGEIDAIFDVFNRVLEPHAIPNRAQGQDGYEPTPDELDLDRAGAEVRWTGAPNVTPNHAAEFHTVEFDTVKFYRATSYAPAMLTIDPSGPGETGASIGFNGTELQEFVKWIQGLAT